MTIGVSLFLIAVGAILAFAVHVSSSGFDIHTIGIILMVVGIIGAILSLLFWSSFSPMRRSRTVVREDRPSVAEPGVTTEREVRREEF